MVSPEIDARDAGRLRSHADRYGDAKMTSAVCAICAGSMPLSKNGAFCCACSLAGLLAADDVEQEAAGQEDAAAADVSQLIRALRLDADGGDDSTTDDADKSN